jgi:N-methylhydantoinase B
VFRALATALGERAVGGDCGSLSIHNANGVHPDGTPWVTTAQCGGEHGPWGATRHGDADSYSVFYLANNLDPATEAIETDVPVVVLRKEYVTDSAGAGTHRGGAAVLKDTLWLSDADQQHGGRTMEGVAVRVAQRVLALAAAIWHNFQTGQPVSRSLTAYDH